MKLGDVYQYKEKFLDGDPTDNHIILGVTKQHIICTLEKLFTLEYFSNKVDNYFTLPIRKILISDFIFWYPNYLYNINDK